MGLWKLIIPELRVLVLTKRHVGSENEIGFHATAQSRPQSSRYPCPAERENELARICIPWLGSGSGRIDFVRRSNFCKDHRDKIILNF